MITLTDPSIMCSVPLQLEKILDGEKEGGGLIHHPDGGEDAQMDVFRADSSWLDSGEYI